MTLESLKLTTTRLSHSFFEVNNDESYKLYFESKDEKTEGQTVSTSLKDFDGKQLPMLKGY